MTNSFCLTIELVPKTCWYNNMRKVLPRPAWDVLRKQVYTNFKYTCGICQTKTNKLDCHEIWHYDDEKYIQTLQGFIALCDWCHYVKHIGYAGILAQEGKLDYQKVVNHFLKINACTKREFRLHYKQAFEQWKERSKHSWQTEFGEYAYLVQIKK